MLMIRIKGLVNLIQDAFHNSGNKNCLRDLKPFGQK